MGIYSTMEITKEDALKQIELHLNKATDNQLGYILFILLGDLTNHNYLIIDDYSKSNWIYKFNEIGLE